MKRFALVAFAPLMLGAASAETLEDALLAAHRANPNLEEARLAVRAAREDSVQARAAYLPQVGVTAAYGHREIETDTTSFFGPQTTQEQLEPRTAGVQLQQQLFTGFRRNGQSRLARAGLEGAREGLRSAEQNVLMATVEAYLGFQRDDEIVRLRQQHVEALTRQLNGARRRLDVGEVSRTDVAQTQTRLAGAQAAQARAEADLETSRARYVAIIGHAPEELEPAPMPPRPNSLNQALRYAEEHHPALLEALAGRRAAQARVTIERSSLLPQIGVVGRYDYAQESSSPEDRSEGSTALAQLSVPLFEGGFARSRTRQARINVARAESRIEAQRRAVLANVAATWNDLEAGERIVAAASQQVEAARIAVEGAERERGLGLRSTLDVLDAEEEARNAQIGLARAQAQLSIAAYALLEATGALSIETLGLSE